MFCILKFVQKYITLGNVFNFQKRNDGLETDKRLKFKPRYVSYAWC